MTGLSQDTEIRKLPSSVILELNKFLMSGDDWKKLMDVIPHECSDEYPQKYNYEHIKMVEDASSVQQRPCPEILLEEWGTSGKVRPTLSFLKQCLLKADLYGAAHYVAVDLLGEPAPLRPLDGPSAAVDCEDIIASAPPLQSTDSFKTSKSKIELIDPARFGVVQLTYLELVNATGNFDRKKQLGRGAWGSVYLALLPELGPVAVKQLDLVGTAWEPLEQFKNEVQTLSQLSHPNLLPLLGYSNDGPELCLVYQYMKHGSLMDRLAHQDSETSLSWRTRIDIGLGTARGIRHLHSIEPKPLVHRDIKSANILLDHNFNPKLGDFGLVRIGSSAVNSMSKALTTQHIIGTSAYMAPEALRGDVSVKMDVFSFGVVLLELLTGLPPFDDTREDKDLITHIQGNVDPAGCLLDKKAGDWPEHIARSLFKLAEKCNEDKKALRPTIMKVVEEYEKCLETSEPSTDIVQDSL